MNPEEADARAHILGLMEDRAVASLLEAELAYCERFPDSAWGWLISVPTLVDLGQFKSARKALRKARKCSEARLANAERELDAETEARLWYWACAISKEQGKFKRAQGEIEVAIEVTPNEGSYWVTYGEILAKRGKLVRARKAHLAAIEAATSDVDEAYYNIALLLRSERYYDEALRHVERALEIDPDYAEAHALRQDLEAVLQSSGHARPSLK